MTFKTSFNVLPHNSLLLIILQKANDDNSFQSLRQLGVVGKFVEFYGPGVSALSIADRATVANMCPEYGATVGFFPVDQNTLTYLRQSSE